MIYVLLSLITGVTIVISMVINGKFSQKEGVINGVIINYLMEIIFSFITFEMLQLIIQFKLTKINCFI